MSGLKISDLKIFVVHYKLLKPRKRDMIAKFDKDMLLVLQPATSIRTRDKIVPANRINNYRNISAERLANVRVIPQMHKIMEIR